jgi:hypothetical protein
MTRPAPSAVTALPQPNLGGAPRRTPVRDAAVAA